MRRAVALIAGVDGVAFRSKSKSVCRESNLRQGSLQAETERTLSRCHMNRP